MLQGSQARGQQYFCVTTARVGRAHKVPAEVHDSPGGVVVRLVVGQRHGQHRRARHERPCTKAQHAAPAPARSLRRHEQHWEAPVARPAHSVLFRRPADSVLIRRANAVRSARCRTCPAGTINSVGKRRSRAVSQAPRSQRPIQGAQAQHASRAPLLRDVARPAAPSGIPHPRR